MCYMYTEKFKENFMNFNARVIVCNLRTSKTDFEKSQALGKKYYGHPAVVAYIS